jgi:hypothetical protein
LLIFRKLTPRTKNETTKKRRYRLAGEAHSVELERGDAPRDDVDVDVGRELEEREVLSVAHPAIRSQFAVRIDRSIVWSVHAALSIKKTETKRTHRCVAYSGAAYQ